MNIFEKEDGLKKCWEEIKTVIKKYFGERLQVDVPYENLLPKSNTQGNHDYIEALDWALQNKAIHNIAITGPYGAGKSSILKTYELHNVQHKYLEISLATFDNKIIEPLQTVDNQGVKQPSLEDSNIIEQGILKQLLYRESKRDLPYSRFRKIEANDGISIKQYGFIGAALMLFFVGKALIVPETHYPRLWNLSDLLNQWFNASEYIIGLIYIGLFWGILNILYRCATYFLQYMRIKEVKTSNVCMEGKDDSKESIFDKYLDEILYFFEVRKYDVVFIEDLDRFEDTGIFIKLRELNYLINSSKRINSPVVFIYALSDDVFKIDTERTKFFDFIIPVMPFINGQNTEGKFKEKLTEILSSEAEIEVDFIKEVSRYIKDMRMLYNICNEFYLYNKLHKMSGLPLKPQKLLALIIYKNFCPEDFAALQYGQGKVAATFKVKQNFIREKKEEMQQKIQSLEEKIRELNKDKNLNIHDWKLLFLNAVTNGRINEVISVQYKSKHIPFSDFLSDTDDFLATWDENNINVMSQNRQWIPINTSDIEKYKKRLENIYEIRDNRIEMYQNEIKKIEEEIRIMDGYSLRALINTLGNSDILSEFQDEKGEISESYKVIVYLLRNGVNRAANGYIDETYPSYLTYFHQGGLSVGDTNFLLSVQNQDPLRFDYPLDDVARVVEEIRAVNFETKAVLNTVLMDFLLKSEIYDVKKQNLLRFLSCESKEAIAFIKEYFIVGKYRDKFVYDLCCAWENIWNYIDQQEISVIDLDRKDEYLKYILKNVPISQLKKLNNCGKLSKYLEGNGRIYYFSDADGVAHEKFIKIINEFKLKFKEIIDLRGKDYDQLRIEYEDVLNAIFEGNHYIIDKWMFVHFVAEVNKWDNKKFQACNYTVIKSSENENIIEYIDTHFENYLNGVWLKLDGKQVDEEKYIIEMLEKPDIDENLKEKIILKEEFQLSNITLLAKDLWNCLFKEKKVATQWMNLIQYIKYDKFEIDLLVEFLNSPDKYENLTEINRDETDITKEDMRELIQRLCMPKSDKAMLNRIFAYCPYTYDELLIKNASVEQVYLLIRNSILTYNEQNFGIARRDKDTLCLFIKEAVKKEIEISSWKLNNDEIFVLLINDSFEPEEKYWFMLSIQAAVKKELAEICIGIIRAYPKEIPSGLYENLFSVVDSGGKIQLIISQLNGEGQEQAIDSLPNVGEEYAKIVSSEGGQGKLTNTPLNRELLEILDTIHIISSITKNSVNKEYIIYNRYRK